MPELCSYGKELVGPDAPPAAARPLTGTEVLHVVQEDPDNPGQWNTRTTTTAAIGEDLGGGGGSGSAIVSADESVSLTATDDGLVAEGVEELAEPTHGLGMDAEGNVVTRAEYDRHGGLQLGVAHAFGEVIGFGDDRGFDVFMHAAAP